MPLRRTAGQRPAFGDADIAALPTNLAATLYQRSEGGVKLLALNTLGVLYVLEKGDSIQSVADLAGRTVYATAQPRCPSTWWTTSSPKTALQKA